MTDGEVSLAEVFIAQIIGAVLGAVSIAAADWSYHTGHIRQTLHSIWVACSVAAMCLPMLAWISNVFLGSGVFSQGLVGMLMGVIFLWVQRNLPKVLSPRKSRHGFSREQTGPASRLRGRMSVPR